MFGYGDRTGKGLIRILYAFDVPAISFVMLAKVTKLGSGRETR